MDPRTLVREMFDVGVRAVRAEALIGGVVRLKGDRLDLAGETYRLDKRGRVFVIGAGKASAAMAKAVELALGDRIHSGLIITKYGHAAPCSRIQVVEAGHPYPDRAGLEATSRIADLCASCREEDLVICLFSGGGSALLADCPPGMNLAEYIELSKALVTSGASIAEINAVRKHLGFVKGGQLARCAWPARIVTLALSDVVGDRLDVIASGPTFPDPTTYKDAIGVLRKHNIQTPPSAMEWLEKGAHGEIKETPKPGDACLSRSTNIVIGSNRTALSAALDHARRSRVDGRIVTDTIEGTTAEAADHISRELKLERARRVDGPAYCLLFGGEPALKVQGAGLGGRNQHLALEIAKRLAGSDHITVLCGGTDGTDGPTDAAGAIVDSGTWDSARMAGMSPQAFLDRFDSYHFFRATGGHVMTGPTMTNVMDVVIGVVM